MSLQPSKNETIHEAPSNSPALQRVHDEAKELTIKIVKLQAFKDSQKWSELDTLSQDLLLAQLSAMQTYVQILLIRIDNWKD